MVGNNGYISQLIERRFGIQAETIHNGIDRRYFFPPSQGKSTDGPKIVLYAGSFRPYKRVDVVVRQAARLPQVQFRVAGEGEEAGACQKLSEELGCRNIHFLGHLSQAEVGEEMRGADVFFFPSILEGHPQVLGQAAGCGLPSVALNSYRPDYVRDGETGFLAGSHEEMGERLDLLLNNRDLRRRMSAAALNHAGNFDWDTIARRWEQVFQQVVAKRQGP
ncbi:MAG TPA: glycosyltransferase [Terriglobales bacterium]